MTNVLMFLGLLVFSLAGVWFGMRQAQGRRDCAVDAEAARAEFDEYVRRVL